jgi:hypothetical protein
MAKNKSKSRRSKHDAPQEPWPLVFLDPEFIADWDKHAHDLHIVDKVRGRTLAMNFIRTGQMVKVQDRWAPVYDLRFVEFETAADAARENENGTT